jgi:AraC family transcriptional regulator
MLRFYSLDKHYFTQKLPEISHLQIRSTLEYLHTYFAQPIALAELAKVAGLSVTHFTRLFRKATGHSPHQYLVRLRCEQAYKLLASGKYTVTQAAQAVGFYDHSHFVRHFKRIYGISPASLLPHGLNVHKPE